MNITHDPAVTVTKDDIESALSRPDSFGYHGDNAKMFDTWALGPIIETRDSGLVGQSNAAALRSFLAAAPSLSEDWTVEHCGHWSCGWVDHLSYRAVEADGSATRIARIIRAWFDALADYPIADESDLSKREQEATIENITSVGRRFLNDRAPEGWAYDACRWFDENDPGAIEGGDHGGYPSDDEIRACLADLGWLDTDD